MSGEAVYKDLIGFLQSERADLRLAASEAVLQVTDHEAMSSLIKYGAIKPLCRLASRSNEPSGVKALESLVQLSSQGTSINQCIEDILDCGGINRMTEIALTPHDKSANDIAWRKRVNFSLALLANMTRTERGAIDLCGKSMPDEAVTISNIEDIAEEKEEAKLPLKPSMALLTASFLNSAHIKEKEEVEEKEVTEKDGEEVVETNAVNIEKIATSTEDPFQHFAAVLMNSTQVEQGRRFVMKIRDSSKEERGTSILERILSELRSSNPIRRRGIGGTVKNCCFEKDAAWWLINEVKIVPKVLYPLAGPEELDLDEKRGMEPDLWLEGPDKVRECDNITRMLLVEAILLLCAAGRRSRESIRIERTYVILKMMDMSESSEEVSDRISDCVQYLRRDEENTQEGSSDLYVEDQVANQGKVLALPAPSASEQVGGANDEDYDELD